MEFRLWVQLWSRAVILTKYAGTCICDDVFPNAGKQSNLVQLWVHIFYILFISCKHSERSWSNCALILALTGLIFHLCCCHPPPPSTITEGEERSEGRGLWRFEESDICRSVCQSRSGSMLARCGASSVSLSVAYFVILSAPLWLRRSLGESVIRLSPLQEILQDSLLFPLMAQLFISLPSDL